MKNGSIPARSASLGAGPDQRFLQVDREGLCAPCVLLLAQPKPLVEPSSQGKFTGRVIGEWSIDLVAIGPFYRLRNGQRRAEDQPVVVDENG